MSRAPGRMRLNDILGEAARNLGAGTTRASLFTLLMTGLLLLLTVFDLLTVTGMITRARTFSERGGSIMIITADNGIDGRVCDSLSAHDGVRAAGALREDDTIAFRVLPQNPVTLYEASPGFALMLPSSTGSQHDGLLLPTGLAYDLGADLGDPLTTNEGDTRLGGTYDYPDDGRPPGMGYAAVAPVAADSQRFDECWIDAYPTTRATTDLLYTALSPDLPDEISPQLSQHNVTLGTAGEPAREYLSRDTRPVPLLAGIAGILVGFLAIWTRRLEFASALHTGAHKVDQLLTGILETAAWAAGALVATVPVILSIAAAQAPARDQPSVITAALLIPAAGFAGALIGAATATLLIREKRLFAYFKGR